MTACGAPQCSALRTIRSRTPGSSRRASRSVALLRCGRSGTTISSSPASASAPAPDMPACNPGVSPCLKLTESSSGRRKFSSMGTTPQKGLPVRRCNMLRAGSSRLASPRNLLRINPPTLLRSARVSSAMVPARAANAPPRSISATRATRAPACRAIRMFTMSCAFRLISAGLPAPSSTITSMPVDKLL